MNAGPRARRRAQSQLADEKLKRQQAEHERDCILESLAEARRALELPLLFHAGGEWTKEMSQRWIQITGQGAATTKVMCDHIRATLAPLSQDCQHDWRDARNQVIESGEVCVKCWAIREAPPSQEKRDG